MAIGGWRDAASIEVLRREKVDLILDARTLFVGSSSNRRPLPDRVSRSTDLLIDLAKKNVKVLVRCHHGQDRSPFVVMVYICRRYGLTYGEAYEMVKSKRPGAILHPEWIEALMSSERGGVESPSTKLPTEGPVNPV